MTSNEQVMSTAKNLVNDTINGATTKLNQMSSKNSSESQNDECGVDKRFLLCLLFDPRMYIYIFYSIAKMIKTVVLYQIYPLLTCLCHIVLIILLSSVMAFKITRKTCIY